MYGWCFAKLCCVDDALPWIGENALSADHLFLQDGFSTTILTSESVNGIDNIGVGISWDGTNTPWSGGEGVKLYLQSGQFSSTLKTSEDVSTWISGAGSVVSDISWDGTDTPWCGQLQFESKMFLQSGQFTSTLKTSRDVLAAHSYRVFGISYNSGDTPWAARLAGRLLVESGHFASTIKTSLDVTSIDANPRGLAWDGTDTVWAGSANAKLYLQSGQFASTLKNSTGVGTRSPVSVNTNKLTVG